MRRCYPLALHLWWARRHIVAFDGTSIEYSGKQICDLLDSG
ncbi:MAG: hypothetical protein COX20_04495 [Desulfobacterales bacterium CG23_combo_of_CG06-09_8_20_14_all_52_9]|nr:MAG: hypothetical protein COX20_04495 [Desulfobacterales bacterium CG23_combo_of_CG06-09_8_20_14_all_52_9]